MYRGKYRVRVTVDGVVTSIGVYETLTDARAALTLARADIVTRSFVSPAERRASARAEVEARRAHPRSGRHRHALVRLPGRTTRERSGGGRGAPR
ncbi:MAG TPA: hypothetical protein DHV14_09750, partial [Micrococcales bacterium]|nr:hypothetical protein [Micrococcales bacterium]